MMLHAKAILAGLLATVSFSAAFQPVSVGSSAVSSSRLYMSTEAAKKMPGTAKLDTPWEDLGFAFRPTNSHVKITWKEGEGWSTPELVEVRFIIGFGYHSKHLFHLFDCSLKHGRDRDSICVTHSLTDKLVCSSQL